MRSCSRSQSRRCCRFFGIWDWYYLVVCAGLNGLLKSGKFVYAPVLIWHCASRKTKSVAGCCSLASLITALPRTSVIVPDITRARTEISKTIFWNRGFVGSQGWGLGVVGGGGGLFETWKFNCCMRLVDRMCFFLGQHLDFTCLRNTQSRQKTGLLRHFWLENPACQWRWCQRIRNRARDG